MNNDVMMGLILGMSFTATLFMIAIVLKKGRL